MKANRASWILHFGEIPDDKYVLHKCDNPACVRPEHLFLGTQLDNLRDMFSKGRNRSNSEAMKKLYAAGKFPSNPLKGQDNPCSKLTDDIVKQLHAYRCEGHTTRDTARKFGVSQAAVLHIGKGRSWKHLGLPIV